MVHFGNEFYQAMDCPCAEMKRMLISLVADGIGILFQKLCNCRLQLRSFCALIFLFHQTKKSVSYPYYIYVMFTYSAIQLLDVTVSMFIKLLSFLVAFCP